MARERGNFRKNSVRDAFKDPVIRVRRWRLYEAEGDASALFSEPSGADLIRGCIVE